METPRIGKTHMACFLGQMDTALALRLAFGGGSDSMGEKPLNNVLRRLNESFWAK